MNLQDVKAAGLKRKRKKRLGCGLGSGHGKTSGRGTKGAGSRSGAETGLYFEGGQMPLVRRIPKRGFHNVFKKEYEVINVEALAGLKEKEITPEVLQKAGLINGGGKKVKVLGKGELKGPIIIHAHRFSQGAIHKIVAAGGEAKVIPC
ncbi:MAG TPA: 50S ribosomal protein L15 [Candidatus Hypogeohydataceae bacterium YC41]